MLSSFGVMKGLSLALILFLTMLSPEAFDSQDVKEKLVERFVPEEVRDFIKKVTYKKLELPHFASEATSVEVCGESLRPSSQDQKEKTYHGELTVTFDRSVPGESPYCHVRQPSGKLKCIVAARLKAKLLSDLYEDACAQTVRAFAWISYTIPGETMTDSVSPGRSLEIVERFNGAALYRPGPISDVPTSRFEFFEAIETL